MSFAFDFIIPKGQVPVVKSEWSRPTGIWIAHLGYRLDNRRNWFSFSAAGVWGSKIWYGAYAVTYLLPMGSFPGGGYGVRDFCLLLRLAECCDRLRLCIYVIAEVRILYISLGPRCLPPVIELVTSRYKYLKSGEVGLILEKDFPYIVLNEV